VASKNCFFKKFTAIRKIQKTYQHSFNLNVGMQDFMFYSDIDATLLSIIMVEVNGVLNDLT
jgi:hypothetical protein